MPIRHRFKDKFLVTRCKCQIYFASTSLQGKKNKKQLLELLSFSFGNEELPYIYDHNQWMVSQKKPASMKKKVSPI